MYTDSTEFPIEQAELKVKNDGSVVVLPEINSVIASSNASAAFCDAIDALEKAREELRSAQRKRIEAETIEATFPGEATQAKSIAAAGNKRASEQIHNAKEKTKKARKILKEEAENAHKILKEEAERYRAEQIAENIESIRNLPEDLIDALISEIAESTNQMSDRQIEDLENL
jgi:hypothetical protein